MLIRRALFAALALMSSLAVVSISQAPPASANHACFVDFYTDINYSGYSTRYPCPTGGSANYWGGIGWPQQGAVSSMAVSMPGCMRAKPFDDNGYVFGPLSGDTIYPSSDWYIADLRPYGWNDRITGLVIEPYDTWNC